MMSPAMMAGAIVIGSTLASAVMFRTYTFEVSPFSWELIRHFNIFFMVCELAVGWLALRSGLDLMHIWGRLGRTDSIALLLWLATFAIGSLLSEQPIYSLVTVSSWPIHLLFGVSIWHLASQAHSPTEQVTGLIGAAIAVVLLALLVMTSVHFFLAPDPATLPQGLVFWPGAVPGFMGVRLFGVVMAYAALFGAGMLLVGGLAHRWQIAAALVLLGFGALCWSSTRAAVPAFFAGLILVAIVRGYRARRQSWLFVSILVIMAFSLSMLVPAPSPEYGTLNVIGVEADAGDDVTAGRLDIWRAILGAIAERPFSGHGEGSTRWLLDQATGMHVQPHNILLQIFLHWGVVAASAAIWLVSRMVLALIAVVRQDHTLLPYAMIVVAAFTAALFDGALYYPQMVMLPVAALAFALGRGRVDAATPQHPQPEASVPAR